MLPSLYTLIQVLAVTGNIKQLKEVLKSTRETPHTVLFLAKQFPFDTVYAVNKMYEPTANAQDRVFFYCFTLATGNY